VKLSVSIPAEDVAFVDEIAAVDGAPSRSSVIHQAISLLRASRLGSAYEEAWEEWDSGPDGTLWGETERNKQIADDHETGTSAWSTSTRPALVRRASAGRRWW